LGLAFFGLTPENAPQVRLNLFTQIHEIVFYGKGGYDWETVYNMPIWLRMFTLSKIKDHYEKEAEAVEKAQNGNGNTVMDSKGNVNKTAFKQASKAYQSTAKPLQKPKN
jgi:hypothetical protein